MAKAKENTKANEEILKDDDVAGTTEETSAPAEATEGENVAEAPVSAKDCTREEKLVTVVMPRYLFTSDPNETHHVVGNQGKNWLIKYDEPMEVPEVIANIVNDAIAQKKKVNELINSLNGKAREYGEE